MADIEEKKTAKASKEERIAAAKARAAGRTKAEAPTQESDQQESNDAAERFQSLKASQKKTQDRTEREAELSQRAVTVAPRQSIKKMPQAEPTKAESLPVNRREFLTYAWGAALGLALVQGGVATLWFSYPRFKEGEFGGTFILTSVPEQGAKPDENLSGKFWWSNSQEGIAALYKVCTHLGCLYEWKDQTGRFECPCHGSKFRQDGRNLQGPATRDLDQFVITVEDQSGSQIEQTTPEKRYVIAQDGLTYKIDTGRKILGRPSDPALALEV